MDYDYDLFVIGAGSGGVRASRVSAAHGARVGIAEEHKVGGTCVIRGCVPKKLLVYGAHFAEDLADARRFGWDVPPATFSWPTLRDNVLDEVARLEVAYSNTLENSGVEIIKERAVLTGPNSVKLGSGREIRAERILLATGATPMIPSCDGCEHGITSNEAFELPELPKRVVIAGAGYIANEFAGIFNELGSKVTIACRSDTILRGYDEQIRDRLLHISLTKGIDFRFNTHFRRVERRQDGLLTIHTHDGDPMEADLLMYAIGRRPHTEHLGLETAGVDTDETGAIRVDSDNRSSCPSVFAVGDITNRVQLTPIALREAQSFADTQYGGKPWRVDYTNIPSAVFSHPPIGAVGMTESEARQKLGSVKVFTSDFKAMKNVLAGRNERALYKLVVNGETDRVVGIHMIGPDAPEILQAAAVAVKAGLTKAQFDETVALHPTMAEELVLMR